MKVYALEQYCKNNKYPLPKYEFQKLSDETFVCKVAILSFEASGNGSCEFDAKQQSALNILKKLRIKHPSIDDLYKMTNEDIQIPHLIQVLTEFCDRQPHPPPHPHPLPAFDIVEHRLSPDESQYLGLCVVGPIECFGLSNKKRGARQLSALKVLEVMTDKDFSLETYAAARDEDSEPEPNVMTYHIGVRLVKENDECRDLKIYRESRLGGIIISSPNNFYEGVPNNLKLEAKNIAKRYYSSDKVQVNDFLRVLSIDLTITTIPGPTNAEPLLVIKLDSVNKVVFVSTEDIIYRDMIEYFLNSL